jgi:hypothetical protein
MRELSRTVVTFKSDAFNTSEQKATFVNPDCFGDDLATWLIDQLRARGIETSDQPDAEDFGWYLQFTVDGKQYCAVIGYRPADEPDGGDWVIWLERKLGFLESVLGRRNSGIPRDVANLLHDILSGSREVRAARWFSKEDFDGGRESAASPTP